MRKRLVFIELNEFNFQLISDAAKVYHLTHVAKLLDLPYHRKTVTSDLYDSGYLEPWVQWVSVHTGSPSSEHKIKHLGDVSLTSKRQIWEELSEQGVSSGIWGAMNAKRGSASLCKFFLPDPWTFEEEGHPREVNHFLGLPRYMARNYLQPKIMVLLKELVKFSAFIFHTSSLRAFIRELPHFVPYAIRYRAANFVTYSFAEYLSALRFLDYWRKDKPQFASLFLNLVAHAQHYYWHDIPLAENDRLRYVFGYLDKILGDVFDATQGEAEILVTNALTQINTNQEPPWILYRQKDHHSFLAAIGVYPKSVEACMTHDAHLFFESPQDCANAASILESCKIGEKRFFHIEKYDSDPTKLFYMINFTDPVEFDTSMSWAGGRSIRVLDQFRPIIRRTAKHSNSGIAMSSTDILPSLPFPNHGIYDVILKYFDLKRSEA
jgi:hypothetical protein